MQQDNVKKVLKWKHFDPKTLFLAFTLKAPHLKHDLNLFHLLYHMISDSMRWNTYGPTGHSKVRWETQKCGNDNILWVCLQLINNGS